MILYTQITSSWTLDMLCLCNACGAVIAPDFYINGVSGREIHQGFHDSLTRTSNDADYASSMMRPLA